MKRNMIFIGLLLILGATAVATFAFTPRAQVEGEGGEGGVTAVFHNTAQANGKVRQLNIQAEGVDNDTEQIF